MQGYENQIQMVCLVVLLIVFAGCEAYEAKHNFLNHIPDNKDAYPYCPMDTSANCVCSQDEDSLPIFHCSDLPSVGYLTTYFDRPFPTLLAASITVNNSAMFKIPPNVFADKQPIRITWTNNFIQSVDPNAFALTKQSLEILEIAYEPELNEFPFKSLDDFPLLRELRLNNNKLGIISDLAEMRLPKLRIINFDFNNMAVEFPKLRFLPELRIISAQASGLIGISKDLPFDELWIIEEINFKGNKNIGSIQAGSFVFGQAKRIANIDLTDCGLVSVETGAFSGLFSNANVSLKDNLLASIPENAFRPMLQTMIGGSGKLDLSGNPLKCDCDIEWLVLRQDLLVHVYNGVCTNGIALENLDSSNFLDCN